MSVGTLPAVQNGYHPPTAVARFNLAEIQDMAQMVCDSRLFAGIQTPQAACALMLLCHAEGLHPMQALKRYHIIEGKPSLRADAMQAEFQARGGFIRWTAYTDDEAAAVFGHKVHCPDGVPLSVTFDQFDRAGVTRGKFGVKDNWKKFPGAMLRARLISMGVRMIDPGCIAGMYTPEEVVDFGPEGLAPEIAPRAIEPPRNNSGHGRGQYAAPDQIAAYNQAVKQYIDKANAEWADRWQDPSTGEAVDKVPELINPWQANGHLLKWAVDAGQLDPGIVPEDAKARQPPMYLAIVYHRSLADRKALAQELRRYIDQQAARLTEKVYRERPELDPDHGTQEADDASEAELNDDDLHDLDATEGGRDG